MKNPEFVIPQSLDTNTLKAFPGAKILVIDSRASYRHVFSELLSILGIHVCACDNVNNIENDAYNAVIIAHSLRINNAQNVAKKLHDIGITAPVIATLSNFCATPDTMGEDPIKSTSNTPHSPDAILNKIVPSWFEHILPTPIDIAQLEAVLTKCITMSHPAPTLSESPAASLRISQFIENTTILEQLRQTFAKSQKDTYQNFITALETNDRTTAHRLMHSLKGLAGLIHEDRLSKYAKALEASVMGWGATKDEIILLQNELAYVIENIPQQNTSHSAQSTLDKAQAAEIFTRLAPLLKDHNAEGFMMVDEVKSIPGTQKMTDYIENFDFDLAYEELKKITKKLDICAQLF